MQISTWNGRIYAAEDKSPTQYEYESLDQLQSEIAQHGGIEKLRILLALAEWCETKPDVQVTPKEADMVLAKKFDLAASVIAADIAIAVDSTDDLMPGVKNG